MSGRALARLYQEEDRPQDLLTALESELETGPDPERALALHARAAELCVGACADPARAAVHYEKVLSLDPTHALASEFLVEQLSVEERHADLARVLETRLTALQSEPETADGADSGELDRRGPEISLRIRIAALRSGPLDDVDGAIEMLAPTAGEDDALSVVAEPLADLYQRAGRDGDLIQLCERAAVACEDALERSDWYLRMGDALRRRGDFASAAGSYRQVLAERPDDRGAPSALRDIYRRLGETEPLVQLLEAELSRIGGAEEVPIRMELATLLEGSLSRPGDALRHLRRVLEIEPGHVLALGRAMQLAEQMGRTAEWLELLEVALERTRSPVERARLLTRRARILAGELARPEEAVESFRSAIALDASSDEARSELRDSSRKPGRLAGGAGIPRARAALCGGRGPERARPRSARRPPRSPPPISPAMPPSPGSNASAPSAARTLPWWPGSPTFTGRPAAGKRCCAPWKTRSRYLRIRAASVPSSSSGPTSWSSRWVRRGVRSPPSKPPASRTRRPGPCWNGSNSSIAIPVARESRPKSSSS